MAFRRRGFTLVEILVVIGILAIIAAILFPVFARAKEASLSKTCLSNIHQLGLGMMLYASDADSLTPAPSQYRPGTKLQFLVGIGWAGKDFPYIKSANVFACPDDSSVAKPSTLAPGSLKISFAANENVISHPDTQTSGSRTVLLFEVNNSSANVTKTDEGMTPRPTTFQKMSAVGNGIQGSLIESFVPSLNPNFSGDDITYATGRLNNSYSDVYWDNFAGDGRHDSGANYLMVDSHSAWARPESVSAGINALAPSNPQSSSGCHEDPATTGTHMPCAEGTEANGPKLTFSAL